MGVGKWDEGLLTAPLLANNGKCKAYYFLNMVLKSYWLTLTNLKFSGCSKKLLRNHFSTGIKRKLVIF